MKNFIDKSNSIIEEKNPKIIIQNNVSTNSNGYTPTNEELDLLKEHQMQHTVISYSKYFDSRYPNPISLPQLYLQEEDYNRIQEEVVGKVLRLKK